MSNFYDLCDFGMVYGICNSTNKHGHSIETTKIRKAAYMAKVPNEDGEYYVCKGCVTHFCFEDYKDDIEWTDFKTGAYVTVDVDC